MFSSGPIASMNTGLHAVEDRMRRIDQLMRSVEIRQSQMNNPVNLPEDPAAMPLSQRLDMPRSPIFSSFLQPNPSEGVSPGAAAVHTGTSRLGQLPDVSQIDVDGLLLDRPVSIAPTSSATKSGSLRLLSGETALQPLIMSLSQKYGMDSRLISAIVAQESNFNPNAVSRSGAQGLMQLMPATAKSLGVTNSTDPTQNLDGGIRYFKSLMTQFKGNVPLALAAYNAGPNAVRQAGGIPHNGETQHYVRKILSNYLGGQ